MVITGPIEHENQVFTESPARPQPTHQHGDDTIFVLKFLNCPVLVLGGYVGGKERNHKLFVQGDLPRLLDRTR